MPSPIFAAMTFAIGLAFAHAAVQGPHGVVPPPQRTQVKLVVSGRTSTLHRIDIECVGQAIPKTYAKDRAVDVAGFQWFVSRHYALQTDYDAARARHLLSVLELAYPHYVELFGREPPGIDDTRMAVVYGASKASLDVALKAVGITWDFHGGGITYEGLNIAYQYPSGSLQYHQRYILLHEGTHLFQMCLCGTTRATPAWFYEGIADALAHHVFEAAAQRLTVNVLDKPTINNWYSDGLGAFAAQPFAARDILAGRRSGRDAGFLLVNYLQTDLERWQRWRGVRAELLAATSTSNADAAAQQLLAQCFGAEALDRGFDTWMRARHSSFRYVDWGWEQDGDALMSYGWPQHGDWSQTDLLFAPQDAPRPDPLVMDYPLHPQSALVGKVARGVPEPTVGCLLSFEPNPDAGSAGLGLGVEGRAFVKVLVEQRRRLRIDAGDLGGATAALDLPDAFRAATATTWRIGLTVHIARASLDVTARADDGGAQQEVTLSLPLTSAQRTRVLSQSMAVLSRGGKHWITPYVDDARRPEPDLDTPAPSNRWRVEGAPAAGKSR